LTERDSILNIPLSDWPARVETDGAGAPRDRIGQCRYDNTRPVQTQRPAGGKPMRAMVPLAEGFEEIEAVTNRHPEVRMSLVRSRKNPITGAIVVADVVLRAEPAGGNDRAAELKREILQVCRNCLAQHKVPAAIRFVPSLDVAATGKMVRHHA